MGLATLGQGRQVLNLIQQLHLTAEELQRLLDSGLLVDLLIADPREVDRERFHQILGIDCLRHRFSVRVGKRSVQDLMSEGQYQLTDPQRGKILAECPEHRGNFTSLIVELLDLDTWLGGSATQERYSIDDLLKSLSPMSWVPLQLRELLDLGIRYPRVIERHRVYALGALAWSNGLAYVPFVYSEGGKRYLEAAVVGASIHRNDRKICFGVVSEVAAGDTDPKTAA